jgi:hypothetical protein
MGPLLAIAAFAGLLWVSWGILREIQKRRRAEDNGKKVHNGFIHPAQTALLLLWVWPYFLLTGAFEVKFMRYLQPITPVLMICGAAWLIHGLRRRPLWRGVAITTVLLATAAYSYAFINIYQHPHPWDAAARWIYRNVPSGTLLLSEQWDDYLPATMVVDGNVRQRAEYPNEELTWLTGSGAQDDEAKLAANLERLERADYVTILSNRVYGVAPRLPARYPLSSQYHQLLFDGSLGYEVVWAGGRFPHLSGFYLKPDSFQWPGLTPPAAVKALLADLPGISGGRADESFTVYDQPLTIIFHNSGKLTAAEMRRMFAGEAQQQ